RARRAGDAAGRRRRDLRRRPRPRGIAARTRYAASRGTCAGIARALLAGRRLFSSVRREHAFAFSRRISTPPRKPRFALAYAAASMGLAPRPPDGVAF